jgi:hypothetical protein
MRWKRDQQVPGPSRRGAVLTVGQRGGRPVEDPEALGALAAAAAFPCLLRSVSCQDIRAGAAGIGGDGLAAGHGDDIADPALLQPSPELLVPAIGLIRGRPCRRNAAIERAGEHLPGKLGLGGELHVVGHCCLAAAVPVSDPRLRQVQLAVDQRTSLAGGIRAEHAQLAVLDPARGTRVLPLHPGRLGALLQKPGLIHHQHAIRFAKVTGHVGAHIITDPVRIPGRRVQQPLHPVRRPVTSRLSQGPPVLAGQRR